MTDQDTRPFHLRRRQKFADAIAFKTDKAYLLETGLAKVEGWIADQALPLEMRRVYAASDSADRLHLLIGDYTTGDPVVSLPPRMDDVVNSYLRAANLERQFAGIPTMPFFDFKHIDDYAELLSLLTLAVLLHREDLVPAIHSLFAGGAPDGEDALVEDILGKFLPDRPRLASGFHDLPYAYLLDATADTPESERQEDIGSFLEEWYRGMRGAGWYDSHKKQSPRGTGGYFGYWAFEAAAIAYLYDIDDAPFRDHLVYPRELADFARSMPRRTVADTTSAQGAMRCEAGLPCPRSGWWHTPARQDSRQRFEAGALMPEYASDYGLTIWQWDENQEG